MPNGPGPSDAPPRLTSLCFAVPRILLYEENLRLARLLINCVFTCLGSTSLGSRGFVPENPDVEDT
jgi:hypothetical protein